MKFLFDFLPVIIFFICYYLFGIYKATGALVVVSAGLILFSWLKNKRVDGMLLATCSLAIILGSITIIFKNDIFIKWKPSVIYWLFSCVFFISQFVSSKPVIQRMLQKNLKLPNKIWTKLNISWIIFFTLMGFANLYVVYNFSTEIWVNFKVFGIMGMTLLFVIVQSIFLSKYIQNDDPEPNGASHDNE